jgi:hypothetical protein
MINLRSSDISIGRIIAKKAGFCSTKIAENFNISSTNLQSPWPRGYEDSVKARVSPSARDSRLPIANHLQKRGRANRLNVGYNEGKDGIPVTRMTNGIMIFELLKNIRFLPDKK